MMAVPPPRRRLWRAPALAAAIAAVLLAARLPAFAVPHDVLRQIAETYEGQRYRLAVELHEPEPGGNPAPSLDSKGWRHNEPTRPVALLAGEEVEVSGVFNYGDQGIFVEITRHQLFKSSAPRVRVRLSADATPDKPDAQMAQLKLLMAKLLSPSSE